MRRLIGLLLILVLTVGLAAGCGKTDGDTGGGATDGGAGGGATDGGAASDIVLTYWTHNDEDAWNESDAAMIAAFEAANPGVKIQHEAFPWDEYEAKIMTSLQSKSGGADIYKIWGGWVLDYADAGVFDPVPDALVSGMINDCYPPVLGALEYNGAYYGLPLEFNAEWGAMLVLKTYFDEHDLSYPDTWAEMIDIAKEHSVSSGDIFEMRGLDFVSFDTVPYIWLQMILSSGGSYLVDGGTGVDFDTPIAKETLQVLIDYLTVYNLTNLDCLTGASESENFNNLFLGEALMAPRGMWTIGGAEEYDMELGVDFDYVATPFYGQKKAWAAETGWSLSVNSAGANKDAAWKFIEFMTDPDNLLQINIDCGMIPPRKSVAHDPDYLAAVPHAEPILNVLDGAQFIGHFNSDVLKEGICNMVVAIVVEGMGIDDAIAELNDFVSSH